MSKAGHPERFYVGWDVGGWNCERNRESRDAIVILDAGGELVGMPWRGNLRELINTAGKTRDWLQGLFSLCGATWPHEACAVLAIDTPLAFSDAFARLLNHLEYEEPIGSSDANPYLFRGTERFLFARGLKPLSPLKDMIGSQATKGMHVLGKFAPHPKRCGVWRDGGMLTAIEAYPSACKRSATVQALLDPFRLEKPNEASRPGWRAGLNHQDKIDALICAVIARLFDCHPEALASPGPDALMSEGWIWVPADALSAPEQHPLKRGR